MNVKHEARLHGRSYAEGVAAYATSIEDRGGGWIAVVDVKCDQMTVGLPLELGELDVFIASLQKLRVKLAEDVAYREAAHVARGARSAEAARARRKCGR